MVPDYKDPAAEGADEEVAQVEDLLGRPAVLWDPPLDPNQLYLQQESIRGQI